MSDFIVRSLITPVNQTDLINAFERVKILYQRHEPKTEEEINEALSKYSYPIGFSLPKSSDVEVVEDLFTHKQLAQLAFLKFCIKKKKMMS